MVTNQNQVDSTILLRFQVDSTNLVRIQVDSAILLRTQADSTSLLEASRHHIHCVLELIAWAIFASLLNPDTILRCHRCQASMHTCLHCQSLGVLG